MRQVAVEDRRRGHGHREHVRRRDVAEQHLRVGRDDAERDVRAAGHAALAVVLVPALVDRDLGLVIADGERGRLERVRPVAVGILEPRAQAARIPVAGTAELGLEAARRDRDHRALVVGRPVRLVVVIELDGPAGRGERDVRAVRHRVQAVVLVPGVVERGLVLVAAGRERERALPDVVARVVREMRPRTARIPVAGAAGLRLQRPRDRDRGRVRRVRRGRRGEQHERRSGEHEQRATKAASSPHGAEHTTRPHARQSEACGRAGAANRARARATSAARRPPSSWTCPPERRAGCGRPRTHRRRACRTAPPRHPPSSRACASASRGCPL